MRGAYGLQLSGVGAASSVFPDAPDGWAPWDVVRLVGTGRVEERILRSEAAMPLLAGGHLRVTRADSKIEFVTPERLTDAELAHPFLAPAAAIAAAWRGDLSFHGGAFVVDGSAWCVLGAAAAGKSSLLHALAAAGTPVISDDLIVVSAARAVYAGPRCLDLRGDAAERLRAGTNLGVVGARERWRTDLGPVEPETPLGGFVTLEWSPDPDVEELGEGDCAQVLQESLAVVPTGLDPAAIESLARLPLLRLNRPAHSWALGDDTARIVAAILRRAA